MIKTEAIKEARAPLTLLSPIDMPVKTKQNMPDAAIRKKTTFLLMINPRNQRFAINAVLF